ncbi:hypothetical protein GCM10027615_71590 [Plantactinospora veratri]
MALLATIGATRTAMRRPGGPAPLVGVPTAGPDRVPTGAGSGPDRESGSGSDRDASGGRVVERFRILINYIEHDCPAGWYRGDNGKITSR